MNLATLVRPRSTPAARVTVALAVVAGAFAAAPDTGSASTTVPGASCAAVKNPSPTGSGSDVGTPAPFGPLSSHPVVDITLSVGEVYTAERVPGGTLVSSFLGGEQYAIDLVADSGSVRWRRCIAAPWMMPIVAVSDDGVPSILLYVSGADPADSSIVELDVATGAGGPPLNGIPAGAALNTWTEHDALFIAGLFDAPASAQSLMLVDLLTLEVTPVPLPEEVASDELEVPGYTLTADGILGFSGDRPFATLGIFVDGAWSSDEVAIAAAMPITIGVDDFDTMAMVAHTGSGATAWTAPGVTDPSREGFHDVSVGDVMLIAGCTERAADGFCTAESLLALDAATGDQLWSSPDYAAEFASGDGYALVNERPGAGGGSTPPASPGYVMIDVATGRQVDGQQWPQSTFWMGCCGDMSFTIERGGAVITSDVTSLQVFLPIAFELLETASVAL